MQTIAITIAFAPASQFARSIIEYRKNRTIQSRHIVTLGHYPINLEKNNRDIKMLCDSFDLELWDPGKNIGSAQSQTWTLNQLPQCTAYWNIDPDSNCRMSGWDVAQVSVQEFEPDCVVISCYSLLVDTFLRTRHIKLEEKTINGIRIGIARQPVPFNLSLWNADFIREIGGVPQLGEYWGETEAGVFHHCQRLGKYHAYLLDYPEDQSGKLLQDRQLLEFKDKNLRTLGPEQFPGIYKEYLAWKYPEALKLDTLIAENTDFQ